MISNEIPRVGNSPLLAIFADFIAPYPYDLQNREAPYHPPTRVHIFDSSGRLTHPYVHPYVLVNPLLKTYEEDKSKICKIEFFTKTPYGFKLFYTPPRCGVYLLGTDKLGRDIFSRLVYGARISLSVGLIGVSITFLLGILFGSLAGYYGGAIDTAVMRLTEVLMSIPAFYLMLTLRAIFPLDMSSVAVFFLIIFILSFVGWAGLARVIRGLVLSYRSYEYVLAAKTYGASTLRIIFKHILPNTYFYLIVTATSAIPSYILGEAALSLLGLGIQEPYPSWGNMLSEARSLTVITFFPWILSPGMAIFLVVVAFNILGDTLVSEKEKIG
ncbi:MAG: ABC transporter permease [Aquificaceae bacterium]|nr:MAG: ABC transporter permease [Aquificaceae bacterium]